MASMDSVFRRLYEQALRAPLCSNHSIGSPWVSTVPWNAPPFSYLPIGMAFLQIRRNSSKKLLLIAENYPHQIMFWGFEVKLFFLYSLFGVLKSIFATFSIKKIVTVLLRIKSGHLPGDFFFSISKIILPFYRKMTGNEYVLSEVMEPHLFVIRKQKRDSPEKVTPMSTYYILDGSIYQAPQLCNVFASRIVTPPTFYFVDCIGSSF